MFKKFSLLLLSIIMFSGLLFGCGQDSAKKEDKPPGEEAKNFKVALVCEGAVNDGGWNSSAYEGVKKIKEQYGAEIAYTEKVAVANMAQVIRTYARQGYNLIFGHGFQFDEPMKTVAAEFPEIQFVVVNGSVTGANLSSTNFKFGELGYFSGMTAALISKSNKIGVVAPMEAPTVVADIDTFKDGAKAINDQIEVSVSYIGSWDDIPKAKEAGQALLSKGNDVLLVMGNSFSIGVFQAAKEAGAKAIGWVSDQNEMAPETIVTSGLQSVESVYLKIGEKYKNGELKGEAYVFGMSDESQAMAPFRNIDQSVIDKVEAAQKEYLDNKLQIKTLY